MNLKNVLRQIEPDRDNLRHDRSPLWIVADPPWHTEAVGGGHIIRAVPLPRFANWGDFNAQLEKQCRQQQAEVLRGHSETIGERLDRDLEAMALLPPAPFEACDQAAGRVNSQALVRYRANDYSVPVGYGYRDVWIRGHVERVVIGCGGEVIARHARCYGREDLVFDPIHYLSLLEQKIGALDKRHHWRTGSCQPSSGSCAG